MVSDFTVYEIATGRAIKTGRADLALIEVGPGQSLINMQVDMAREGVDHMTGTVVPFTPPAPAPARVGQISPRQMILGLLAQGYITGPEALAAATSGTIPPAVETVVSALPPDAQIAARVTWARMTVVLRDDPLVGLLAASQGLADAEVDAFFAACAAL